MAEEYKINFYPKPAPPTNPMVIPFEEIQRLLAKAPAPPTHEPGAEHACKHTSIDGPKKAAIQCTNRGANQFR